MPPDFSTCFSLECFLHIKSIYLFCLGFDTVAQACDCNSIVVGSIPTLHSGTANQQTSASKGLYYDELSLQVLVINGYFYHIQMTGSLRLHYWSFCFISRLFDINQNYWLHPLYNLSRFHIFDVHLRFSIQDFLMSAHIGQYKRSNTFHDTFLPIQ